MKRMMAVQLWRHTVAVSILVLAFAGASSQVQAYEWDLQGTLGAGVPLGELSDTHDPGVGLGLGLTRWYGKRIGFHLGLAGNMLGGKGSISDLTLLHYNAGAEFDLIDPATSKLRLHTNVGLGATTASAENVDSSTDFTVNLGPNLEYRFNDHWNGLVGFQVYVIAADNTETVLPVYAGFRYVFSE